jgi:hypothetical protein
VGGLAWLRLRRIRNVFAAFYLQTQTHRRTKQTSFVSPNTINHSIKNKNQPQGLVYVSGGSG